MKLHDEETAKRLKKKLEEEMSLDPNDDTREFSSYEINWKKDLISFDECVGFMKDCFIREESPRLFFVAHDNDEIIGKPQLIHETIQRMPLIRTVKKIMNRGKTNEEIFTRHKFVNERVDKRYDGRITNTLNMDFWVYKIVYEGREYYILSEKELGNEVYRISGMKIFMEDFSELTNSLKVSCVSNLFIVKDADPFIKTIDPDKLVKFTKELEINKEKFHNLLFLHQDGKIYDYGFEFDMLRKAQLLSGKYEGYPLHIFKMGPVGTGKTTEAEVLNYKFWEDQGILEAANSTLKSIVPSFKEKPANLGYICKCNRIAIIDEMMKMVESAMTHDNSRISNYFGQMNMLLEHKDRMIGSGNDNSTRIQATSKVCITTNNINRKHTIESHLGIIDPTTLSRMVVWVQDYKEISKIYDKVNVKIPPTQSQTISCGVEVSLPTSSNISNNSIYSRLCVGGISDNDFLTIFDSCQNFLVNYDENWCRKIFNTISNLCLGQMQQVWRARGLHHVILILDGVTKHRCLFEDYDDSFNCNEKDYNIVERILIHMVNGWKTSYEPNTMKLELNNIKTHL